MTAVAFTRDDISDRELRKQARERFATAERLEMEYMRALRSLARQVEAIVKGMAPDGEVANSIELQQTLEAYAQAITPWARSVAAKMIARIAKKDENAWSKLGKDIGRALRSELQDAPTGDMLRQMLNEQVDLITSLPKKAAQRVHVLTTEGIVQGRRASEIAADILATGKVTESRAKLIARTEIARTASGLTMARAKHVGSTHYVWRTSRDVDVRKSHKEMEGVVVPWTTAPILSDGTQTHAGMIYNCRCYPEPLLMSED